MESVFHCPFFKIKLTLVWSSNRQSRSRRFTEIISKGRFLDKLFMYGL